MIPSCEENFILNGNKVKIVRADATNPYNVDVYDYEEDKVFSVDLHKVELVEIPQFRTVK